MSNETYIGMNARTGGAITDDAHIRQSVKDILITPIGSRLMRRNYGSQLFALIDQPHNPALRLKITSAIYSALMRWESRITPTKIVLDTDEAGRVFVTLQARHMNSLTAFNATVLLREA